MQRTTGRKRQRHPTLLVALAEAERAATFADLEGVQFQRRQIADAAPGVQEHVKDGVGPQVLPESFRAMVAMAEEDKTLAKRFARTPLRQESLVGPEFDSTGMYPVASTDIQKKTAGDYAASLTDPRVLRRIQRKSEAEADLIKKRLPSEKQPAPARKGL
ncbi:MAG: hypothetical protein NTY19_39545 [Planctomycetota bacterium]|nr:hypothetical protein [Planctomycetota bacterium]